MAETPSPEEIAEDALARLAEALRAAGRDRLRAGLAAHGMRLTLGVRRNPQPKLADPTLPAELAGERRATRRVYAIIRAARDAPGGAGATVRPADIVRLSGPERSDERLALSTVGHALTRLCKLNLIVRDDRLGYHLGSRQPSLPFFEGQGPDLSESESGG